MSTQQVEVFLGAPLQDRNELYFLGRLRADLEKCGPNARIFANFTANAGANQRQVDFLILTAARLTHVELKTLDPAVPIIAKANGPWLRQLPGGTPRPLEHNFYRQAHDATYAINDDMRRLSRAGVVPPARSQFFREIDTVVCLNPGIPAGSQLQPYGHVTVIGYGDLLARLTAPGPRPAWGDGDWDTFVRELNLYLDVHEGEEQLRRRARQVVLDDYRRRFVARHATGLHELVSVPAGGDDGEVAEPLRALLDAVGSQRTIAFTGPSGAGKSHTALHAALATAEAGGTPVWLRCAEYEGERLSVALTKAVAPFTTEACLPLLERTAEAGKPAVVILDGLNECTPHQQKVLLEQLGALRLRVPVAAIVTSTEPLPLQDSADSTHLSAGMPQGTTRTALLASYGAERLPGADAFTTPLELSLAAECADVLPPDASVADLFDLYVRTRSGSETVREGLRRLAAAMDDRLRRSLTMAEALTALRRGDAGPTPATVIDEVLRCPLLTVGRQRVAFTHELFARFLATEHLVLTTADTDTLATALLGPGHGDLLEFAVALEQDQERRHGLLLALADVSLLRAAVRGEYGPAIAARVKADVAAALTEAGMATASAELQATGTDEPVFSHRLRTLTPRTRQEQAFLDLAGACLREGEFIPEVAALIDLTDRRCAEAIRHLIDDGHHQAVSAIVCATYALSSSGKTAFMELPATVIVRACEADRITRWTKTEAGPMATAMWSATPARPRWGRLYTALMLVNPDDRTDHRLLPDLFQAAWAEGGYHLRLAALTTVTERANGVDEATQVRMRELLGACDPGGYWGLASSLTEALAAYEAIEPANSADDIRALIAAILAEPQNPEAWAAAEHVIGAQFDNADVVGPFYEVIAELEDQQLMQLCVMAARVTEMPINRDYILNQIVERLDRVGADPDAIGVVREAALTVDRDNPNAQEAVFAHLEGLRGWAKLADHLPPPAATDGDLAQRAWRIFDELVFALMRGTPLVGDEADRRWAELLDLCAPAAVDVLDHLRAATLSYTYLPERTWHDRLVAAYPDQVLQLLEWGLINRDKLTDCLRSGPPDWRADRRNQHLLNELGRLGNARTASLLRAYVVDPDIGNAAVEAIRGIEARTE